MTISKLTNFIRSHIFSDDYDLQAEREHYEELARAYKEEWGHLFGIETLWSSEWLQGYGCEAMMYVGQRGGEYFWAFEVEPGPDIPVQWQGPVATREEAQRLVDEAYEDWR